MIEFYEVPPIQNPAKIYSDCICEHDDNDDLELCEIDCSFCRYEQKVHYRMVLNAVLNYLNNPIPKSEAYLYLRDAVGYMSIHPI